jgi:hypothetical protein
LPIKLGGHPFDPYSKEMRRFLSGTLSINVARGKYNFEQFGLSDRRRFIASKAWVGPPPVPYPKEKSSKIDLVKPEVISLEQTGANIGILIGR